ncbi:Ig-like domain-containing protein, partial [Akkermansiaceae bacterium]|nr:Ig-like domain-containing protein [Akkermansiaceae bacterium]
MKPLLLTALLSASSLITQGATLSHRWSFDGDTNDSISGVTGVLQGGATIGGGQLTLSGAGSSTTANRMSFSSPIDIGGNFGATGVTIETWYTDTGTGTWGKLFQFGNNASGQELAYTHTRGSGEQSGVDRDGTQLFNEQISQNVEHHLVITVSANGNLNAWVDGVQKLTNTNTNDLSNVTTTFEAIGATSWGDPGMRGNVNEFRIWSGELSGAEVTSSFAAGPNNLPGNGPLITSFASSHATRQEGESATLSWSIDDTNVTGTLNVEIRDAANAVIHTSSSANGNTSTTIGDTGGSAQTFTYTLNTWDSDSPGDIRSNTVDIGVAPGIPSANPQSLQTVETAPLAITLTGSDPNTHPNPSLTFSVLTPPTGGLIDGTPPNLTYTAQVGFSGEDSFTFTANDGKYDSPPATISITVNKAPTAPTALTLSSLEIPSTVINGGYLATLITEDPNDEDTHTYALVSGAGSADNSLFSIVGSQLRAASVFSGQVGNLFAIRLRTTDQGGLFFEKSFSLRVVEPSDEIVINEIHANPPLNYVRQEFIELHNPSAFSKDLSGWRLSSA